MKLNFTKKIAGIGAVAAMGMVMSGTVAAETFTATATVQNALTVVKVNDMALGTIFATTASSGVNRYMTLGSDGTMGSSLGDASLTLIGLGGHSVAQASIAVGSTADVTVTLPDAEPGTAITGIAADTAELAQLPDVVWVDVADPDVAKFQLINFTVGNVGGGTAGANCSSVDDDSGAAPGTVNLCTLTPTFGSTSLTFDMGATIVTDTLATGATRNTYAASSAYDGNFTVTATY